MSKYTMREKKGHWVIEYGDFSGYLQCSECGGFALTAHATCPLCGARMDGDDDE